MKEVNVPTSAVSILAPSNIKEGVTTSENLRTVESTTKLASQSDLREQERDEQELLISDVRSNLEKLNEVLPIAATNLSFEFDETGKPPFIRVIDKGSDEVIREIPSEEFREVAKALEEFADKLVSKGFLFNQTA